MATNKQYIEWLEKIIREYTLEINYQKKMVQEWEQLINDTKNIILNLEQMLKDNQEKLEIEKSKEQDNV